MRNTFKKVVHGIDKKKIWGFIIAFLLLLGSYILLLYSTNQLKFQAQRVDHTNSVMLQIEKLLSGIRELGYNYRGYIITENEKYAQEYFIKLKEADSTRSLLKSLINDNEIQQSYIDSFNREYDERIKKAIANLEAYRFNKSEKDSFLMFGYEKHDLGILGGVLHKMGKHEKNLLQFRKDEVEDFSGLIQGINIISLALAIFLAVFSVVTYIAENKEKKKSEEKAEQFRLELEKRIQELIKANKELNELRSMEKFASTGRIARTMAHEIRNPLTNIHLATEQIKDSITPGDDNEMLLKLIERNGNRINELITALLNATKVTDLNYTSVELNTLLDSALELAKDRIELNQVTVQKQYGLPGQHIYLRVDFEKIQIAFLNIILNAIEAMEQGKGILTIEAGVEDNFVKVEISDNGSGMSEETVSKLFEPFFTSKPKGNGLGLTNTQNIILNHKGKIEVTSTEGKGTRFIISLKVEKS